MAINKFTLPIYFLTALIIPGIFLSCSSPSSPAGSSTDLKIKIEPEDMGTVKMVGDTVIASADRGSVFLYWKQKREGQGQNVRLNDSLSVDRESVDSLTAVFGSIRLDNPTHLKSGPYSRNAYFVQHFELPNNAEASASVSAVYRASLHNGTKEKVLTTSHRIRSFDISHDGDYISFTTVNQENNTSSSFEQYIGRIQTGEISYAGAGAKGKWANRSNKLLIGSKDNLCIYEVQSNRCQNLPTEANYHKGFWAAAWSPNDEHLLVSRSQNTIDIYRPESGEKVSLDSQEVHEYFTWLDDQTFITNGAVVKADIRRVLKYAIDSDSAETLSFTASYDVKASPSLEELVYINDGINLYNRDSQQSNNILNYYKWDPHFPNWMEGDRILFYNREDRSPYYLSPNGRVFEL